jgi:uncharacterized protein (TIGR02246 family)
MRGHENNPADEQAIRDLVTEWLRASKAGDHAMVLKLMADDVVFLLPGQPVMRKADFVAAQNLQAAFDIESDADIQEIRVFGDWAYCWNHLTVTIKPHDGSSDGSDAITRRGPVLSVLHKENGRWVIKRDANMLTIAD